MSEFEVTSLSKERWGREKSWVLMSIQQRRWRPDAIGSQSAEFTVVWFSLSSRIVISLSSHYWNLVLRIGQSFPAIIASICSKNTCVLAIKISKTLQAPHAPPWTGSLLYWCFTWIASGWESGLQLAAASGEGVAGGSTAFAVRLQWQIRHRHLPWVPKVVVMCVTSYTRLMSQFIPMNLPFMYFTHSFCIIQVIMQEYDYENLPGKLEKIECSSCACLFPSIPQNNWDLFLGIEMFTP